MRQLMADSASAFGNRFQAPNSVFEDMSNAFTQSPILNGHILVRRKTAHRQHLATAIVIALVVIAGFWRSYYFKALYPTQEPLTLLVHIHGALMSAWIVLLIAQILLVAAGRTDLHRRAGRFGIGLLAAIAAVAIPTMLAAARLGGNHMPGPVYPGLALVIGLLFSFLALATAGLLLVRRPDFHQRLMIVAAIAAMEAGTSRIPLAVFDSLLSIHVANDSILLLVVVYDTVRHRRLHPAFLWGAVFLVGMQTLTAWVSGTGIWLRLAHQIVG
ncbi:MAG: hypothetical protein JSR66_17585 [Proteobacteria bacterium]|nr:hypothetical protein [Pseudomonadota bacterium]